MGGPISVTHVSTIGCWGGGDGEFYKPCHMAFDPTGNLYIADGGAGLVKKHDRQGEYLAKLGQGEGGWLRKTGKLNSPTGVAIAQDGSCYVTDVKLNTIFRFRADGTLIAQFGSKGKRNGELDRPRAVRIDAEGCPWILDAYNHRVQRFDPDGRFMLAFGARGDDPEGRGMFNDPGDIAIDAEGRLFVADTWHNCVQVFDPQGTFLGKFGVEGKAEGQLIWPRGLAFDAGGRLWVVERANHRVQAFDTDGRFLYAFGRRGGGDGELEEPYGIAIKGPDLYVSDNGNHRLQRFAIA